MPPYSGPPNPRRWTSPLQVDGRPVFTDDGRTLSKYGYEVLLGWVEHGNLTDLGMQAVKDGWWVDPPDEVQAQVRRRQHAALPPPQHRACGTRSLPRCTRRDCVANKVALPASESLFHLQQFCPKLRYISADSGCD